MTFKTVLLGATAAMGLATGAMAQDDKTKVGFIYVGPIGDLGWSYQHDQGRLAVEEEYGDKVETVYVESVPEGPDAERVLTQQWNKTARCFSVDQVRRWAEHAGDRLQF